MPDIATVKRWRNSKEDFSAQYARARQEQADYLAEQCIKLSDSATAENAQAIRLAVDTRKWYAGKMHPRFYGDRDRPDITVNNTVQNIQVFTEERRKQLQERHLKALGE